MIVNGKHISLRDLARQGDQAQESKVLNRIAADMTAASQPPADTKATTPVVVHTRTRRARTKPN